MAISKLILNGVIQMDVTGVTVEASNLLAPNTAVGADGQPVTGTATEKVLTTKSITANGTYDAEDDNADGYSSVTVNVPSSGASSVVTGTFKGTTTGAAMDVNISYTGSGYPIAFIIYPTEGPYNSNTGSFYPLVQRYACAFLAGVKSRTNTAPNYENSQITDNAYSLAHRFKNSTTNSTNYSVSAVNAAYVARNINAESSSNSTTSTIVTFRAKNKMSVFIASTSYGFAANIEYTYRIIYSS